MTRYVIGLLFFILWLTPSVSHAQLIERLMGQPGFVAIPIHTFFALNQQRIDGALTRQNVIDALNLSGADITDYDNLVTLAPTGTAALNVAQKAMYLNSVHAVLILAEAKVVGYTTPALVRAKLGIP